MAPAFAVLASDGTPTWKIRQYSVDTGQAERTLDTLHYGAVQALAAKGRALYCPQKTIPQDGWH